MTYVQSIWYALLGKTSFFKHLFNYMTRNRHLSKCQSSFEPITN